MTNLRPLDGPSSNAAESEALQSAVEALAGEASRCGFSAFHTVPGQPATEVAEALRRAGVTVYDAHDEKTAVETALGLAIAGAPSGVVAKGNGGLILAEALQNAGPHQVGGVVVFLGDDVRAESSTVPTDARDLARHLQLPALEPLSGDTVAAVVRTALDLSVKSQRPVILRFTSRLGQMDTSKPTRTSCMAGPPVRPDRVQVHQRTKLDRYLDFTDIGASVVQDLVDRAPTVRRAGTGKTGAIVSGLLWETLVHDALRDRSEPVLALTASTPVPRCAVDFCRSLDRVVVFEEGRPVVEEALAVLLCRAGVDCHVDGQGTGHIPPLGPQTGEDVQRALGRVQNNDRHRAWKPAAAAKSQHPYSLLFDVLRDVRVEQNVTVHGCVGSCIAAAYPPWQILDSAVCLGASINVASGAALALASPTIALIGDYAIVHSGLSGHDQVYQRGRPVLSIVLANGRSDKTGGQPSPVGARLTDGVPLELVRLLGRAAPPSAVQVAALAEHRYASLKELITELLRRTPATLVLETGGDVYHASGDKATVL